MTDDLRELRKCRRLATWLQSVEAAVNWVVVTRHLLKQIEETPIELRSGGLEVLRGWEAMLGGCVLHVIGVFPLGSGHWDDCPLDDEIDPRET